LSKQDLCGFRKKTELDELRFKISWKNCYLKVVLDQETKKWKYSAGESDMQLTVRSNKENSLQIFT